MKTAVKIRTQWKFPSNINKNLIFFLIYYCIGSEFLISVCAVPSAIRYLNDIIVAALFVCSVPAVAAVFKGLRFRMVPVLMVCYAASLLVGLSINGGSLLLVLWAARNVFRFFAFFLICVVTLESEDVLRLIEGLYRLQWINFGLCLFEYFVLHMEQDNLGGMFGTAKGCNGSLNTYLCIISTYIICKYLDRKCTIRALFSTLITTLLIASLAELKMVYVELLLIVIAALFLGFYRERVLPVLLSMVIGAGIGLLLLKQLFPEHFNIITNLNSLIAYGSSEGGGYDLSRFHAFKNINILFFDDDIWKKLFGLGFGNCEYSSFSFLTSPFYQDYGQYHYRWFAHQMMYLETGYVGLGLFISVLICIMAAAFRCMRHRAETRWLDKFVVVFAGVTIVCLWYNAAIRTEAAYLTFFALSIAAVNDKCALRDAKQKEGVEINEAGSED